MKALFVFVVVIVVACGAYFYFSAPKPAQPPERGTATIAVQSILITGVKNDLNGIFRAEKACEARTGKFASLDELVTAGDLRMDQKGRQGYTYTIENTDITFTVTARYSGPAQPPYTSYQISSDNMEIRAVK
ncbi:MAG: hypothetical protein HY046_00195 [Acidobacteria bacterium]|nr:hypothetical protein [Acidobacteriota bacterium]